MIIIFRFWMKQWRDSVVFIKGNRYILLLFPEKSFLATLILWLKITYLQFTLCSLREHLVSDSYEKLFKFIVQFTWDSGHLFRFLSSDLKNWKWILKTKYDFIKWPITWWLYAEFEYFFRTLIISLLWLYWANQNSG